MHLYSKIDKQEKQFPLTLNKYMICQKNKEKNKVVIVHNHNNWYY